MKPLYWIDAFAETRFAGNPCAVVLDADDVDVETRVAFTRETRLSECAFLVRSTAADLGARYYLASGEIPMAGHPTIATIAALIAAGRVAPGAAFSLEVGAGVIAIETEARPGRPPLITMTQLRPEFGREWPAGDIAALYGLATADVVGTPRTVSTGTPFCVTRLTGLGALRRARLDADALAVFKTERGADFFEPFLCATAGFTAEGDTAARLMSPPPEPPEDSFTGSATGCMAAYLWATDALPGPRLVAEQGHDLGRPGRAEVELLGPRDDIAGVRVAGSGVVVFSGAIDL